MPSQLIPTKQDNAVVIYHDNLPESRRRIVTGRVVLFDADDYLRYLRIPMTISRHNDYEYVKFSQSNKHIRFSNRVVCNVLMNCPNELEVDHINGDTFDCRKINLRNVTHQQNNCNRTSFERGVTSYKTKSGIRYKAQVNFEGTTYAVYGLVTKQAAIDFYQRKSAELFGEFKRSNNGKQE